MNHYQLELTAMIHFIEARMRKAVPGAFVDDDQRDRGSVSIEQVLWYAAAAVSVAVVAGLIWNAIQRQAETTPASPGL